MAAPKGDGIFSQMIPNDPDDIILQAQIFTSTQQVNVLKELEVINYAEHNSLSEMLRSSDKEAQKLAVTLLQQRMKYTATMIAAYKKHVIKKPEGEM